MIGSDVSARRTNIDRGGLNMLGTGGVESLDATTGIPVER